MYLDFKLDSGATMTQPVPEGWNGFVYVLSGEGKFGGGDSWTDSDAHHTLVLSQGDHVQAKNTVSCTLQHCSYNNILQPSLISMLDSCDHMYACTLFVDGAQGPGQKHLSSG